MVKVTQMKTAVRGLHTYSSILETIGKTPIVQINNLDDSLKARDVSLFAKLEYFNPLSSVKDRLALAVIEDAERKGVLKPGMTVVEASSGNTGIGLAMVCAQKKYKCVITMADSYSVERRKVMRMLGAKVILTPAAHKGIGMVKKAEELAEKNGWFLTRQFVNEANTQYHCQTTGSEILQAFSSNPLTHFVSGYGTGGTFTGVGRALRQGSPNTKIILAEPTLAPLFGSGIEQKRLPNGDPDGSHPSFAPHLIQGWTPDFVPMLAEKGKVQKLYDEVKLVAGEDGIQTAKDLASKEGVFTGISGGSSMATALAVAKEAPDGSNILAMIPDTAERYLSTALFADIQEAMDQSEMEISQSTPSYQL